MKKYYFRDSDDRGFEERDIYGDSYRELLSSCCKYSSTFVLLFPEWSDTTHHQNMLSPFETEVPNTISKLEIVRLLHCSHAPSEVKNLYRKGYGFIKFYRICPELFEILPVIANSVFTWLSDGKHSNPENPTFYRSDGSIFFSSVTHEGVCKLTPRDDEDVSQIIANPLWVCYD